MQGMTIAGLAQAGDVGVETVRFYQRRGLLEAPPRDTAAGRNGIRRYTPADVQRLRFIRSAQAAGFTLTEIADLLALDPLRDRDRERVRELSRARIAALDAKIAQLTAARQALTRLEKECRASAHGPCPIIQSFEAT